MKVLAGGRWARGEAGAKRTDHLKTASCKSLIAYCSGSWDLWTVSRRGLAGASEDEMETRTRTGREVLRETEARSVDGEEGEGGREAFG
jgi:hypothetical protein